MKTAEEIMEIYLGHELEKSYSDVNTCRNLIEEAMEAYATQQNIKMPTEDEIIEAALRQTTHKSLLPAHRGLMKDYFIIGAKWLRNQITEK